MSATELKLSGAPNGPAASRQPSGVTPRIFPSTAVKIVATHGKGTAYTVQLPGVATAKTVEGAAIRVG